MNCDLKRKFRTLRATTLGVVLCLLAQFAVAQAVGEWQTHFNYASAQTVAVAKEFVYCATKNGFFYYQPKENKTVLLSTKDGLSETAVSRIKYEPTQNILIIGHENGAIDLLQLSTRGAPETIKNFLDITNAPQIEGSRRINHINIRRSDVYLACDFGVVVFDLAKQEIRSTIRNIGPNGQAIRALSTAFANDSLYISTPSTVLAASLGVGVNLQFFGNWKPIPTATNVAGVAAFQNNLFVALRGRGVFKYERGLFMSVFATNSAALKIQELTTGIVLSTESLVRTLTSVIFSSNLLTQPQEVAQAEDGTWFVADAGTGLLSAKTGEALRVNTPNGPSTDVFGRLYAYANQLIALKQNQTEPNATLDYYNDTDWTTAQSTATGSFSGAALSLADKTLYLSNFGNGIWQLQPDGKLLPATATPALDRARLTGIAIDRANGRWAVGDVRFGEGTLFSNTATFPLGAGAVADVLITENTATRLHWVRLQAGGLLACDATTTLRTQFWGTGLGAGNLPSAVVNDFVVDLDGRIWLATNSGVAVIDNPTSTFSTRRDAFRPVFGTGFLLRNEACTAIAVDAANRKWIGTRNSGLFLFNESGTELIARFSTANAPLPSNFVVDVAVVPATGLVFVATPSGLVSYGGTAIAPAETLSAIQIYPNPVRPDFTGSVVIKGLTADSNLKITDITGRLVHETRSQGGSAAWNLITYRGQRAETGVYLVFITNQDGSESLVGKLGVVR